MFSPRHPRSQAFTLLELIVVVVVLAVLAAVAIPTFAAVTDRSRDRAAEASLSAYARSVQAHAAFRGDGKVTAADFEAAAADFPEMSASPGVSAAGDSVVVRPHPTRADRFPVQGLSVVSYAVDEPAGAAAASAVSASGNCVAVRLTASSVSVVRMPAADELCTGRTALDAANPEPGVSLDPENPADLQAPVLQYSSRTTTTVTLSWAAVPGAASYVVEVSGSELMTGATSAPVTDRSFVVSATWDSPRYVRVSAVAGKSRSTPSGVVRVVGALEAPQDVVLVLEDATATISWSPVPGATGYRVYQDGSNVFVRDVQGVSTSFSLSPGQSTSFVVKAYNLDGESSASASVNGTVTASTPSGVTARVEGDRVVVSWSRAASSTGYEVYRDGVVSATTVGTDSTSASFGIAPGETATFAVRSYDSKGYSPVSPAVSATRAPAVPAGVSAAASGNSATLSWGAVSGATHYDIFQDGAAAPTVTVSSLSASFVLADGQTASWTVRARNVGGSSLPSGAVSVSAKPAAPVSVSASASGAQVTVSWPRSAAATSYRVYRGSVLVATVGDVVSWSQPSVPEGDHVYSVAAGNTAGWSAQRSAPAVTVAPYSSVVTATSGLVGYWRLGNEPGTSVPDASGNGHTAVPQAGVSFGQGSLLSTSADRSAFLPGSNSASVVAQHSSFNVSALTIEAWIRTPDTMGQRWRAILGKQGTGRDYNFYGMSSDNDRIDELHFSSAVFNSGTSGRFAPLEPNTVHHVVFTVSSTGVHTYYLDGVLLRSWQGTAGTAAQNVEVRIGQADNTWRGGLDEVAVYNRALTASEVALRYTYR